MTASPTATATPTVAVTPVATPTAIAGVLSQVREASLREHVVALAAMRSRYPGTPGHAEALRYIEQALAASGSPFVARLPATANRGPQNVSAVFGPRADPSAAVVWLTAHYDSIADRTPGWNRATDPAPGANDNGTGVAAVLEIARILAAEQVAGRLAGSVGVLFLDEEETGMKGSLAAARTVSDRRPRVVNLDMVGFSAPATMKLDLLRYASSGDLADRAAAANERYGLKLKLVDRLMPAELRTWVDSTPFAMAGIPAITLTESYGQPGIDYPGYPSFHRIDDTPDKISNLGQWRSATQLVLAMALELAR